MTVMSGVSLLHGWNSRFRRSACTVLTVLLVIYFVTGLFTSTRPTGLSLIPFGAIQIPPQVRSFVANLLQVEAKPELGRSKTLNVSERFTMRQTQISKVCAVLKNDMRFNKTSSTGMGVSYLPGNVAYCAVPKAGCTFWKQIFRFANHEYSGNLTSPFDIKRHEVHYPSVPVKSKFKFQTIDTLPDLKESFKFTFVRDPYARLWSAYLHKFVLADFWRTFAKSVVRSVRKNPSAHNLLCADDVTFEEFLTFVVKTEMKHTSANEHWQPIYKICNPCKNLFDAIGTQESFSSDSKFLLTKLGQETLLENRDFNGHVEEELRMLVKYNTGLKRSLPRECFDDFLIAQRIWKVFQANAYFNLNSTFPVTATSNSTSLSVEELTNIVLTEFRERGVPKSMWKKQRYDIMVAAYRQVPISVLKDLENVYAIDFQLFGYQQMRKDLYGER